MCVNVCTMYECGLRNKWREFPHSATDAQLPMRTLIYSSMCVPLITSAPSITHLVTQCLQTSLSIPVLFETCLVLKTTRQLQPAQKYMSNKEWLIVCLCDTN